MLLAIDVGNSNTSIGVFEGETLRCEVRLATRRDWTRDEFAIKLERALALQAVDFSALDGAILASVVPPVTEPIVSAIRRYAKVETLVVGPSLDIGMPVLYHPPTDVGADRIVAAIAAHTRYARQRGSDGVETSSALIIVDFGTATTFDVVSPAPEYLGGVIAPGVGISADALFRRAAKLPRVDVIRPQTVIGRNTVGAIQSGLFFGYVGLVEGVLRRLRDELRAEHGWEVRVIATGGLARKVAPETDAIDYVDDNLMLDGLYLLYRRNTAASC